MSRAYKNSLVDEADDLSTGALNATGVEKLSGADLEQVRLAALNGSNPAVDSAGVKTLGTIGTYAGTPNAAKLTGSDLERYAGDQ
jgi:hypothetical protein